MATTDTLSAEALVLLRRHAERKGDIPVDDSTRETYRELARQGLMVVGHSFTGGRESVYRLTELGWKLARVLDPPAQTGAIADRQHAQARCGDRDSQDVHR